MACRVVAALVGLVAAAHAWQAAVAPSSLARPAPVCFATSRPHLAARGAPLHMRATPAAATVLPLAAFAAKAKAILYPLRYVISAALVLIVGLIGAELKRRKALISAGDECMLGDDAACASYDESVESTPVWKLRLSLSKLAQTNVLADKLSGPPPMGFTWGKTF